MSSPKNPESNSERERYDIGGEFSESDSEPVDPTDPAASGSLGERLRKLLSEKEELASTLVRRQADFDNYRKRVEKERHQERHRGAESLIENLLPVLDAFDRALGGHGDAASADYLRGFELIRKQLWDVLAKQGLSVIDSVGREFNPHFHHAIEQVPTNEHEEGVVLAELQPGYSFHGRVLRPAMVRVSSAPEPKGAPASRREK